MIKNALQAQLLKAGLVDNKKAKKLTKQAQHEQRTGQNDDAEIKAKNVKAIDSNGAGDIFAGAALNKIIEEESFLNACKFGNYASSKIVQEKSPRLSVDQYKKLKADY